MSALMDSGAEANFLSSKIARLHFDDYHAKVRHVRAIDGHRIRSYGETVLDLRVIDSAGCARNHGVRCHIVDMDDVELILGYPWLSQTNPDIDWSAGLWQHRHPQSVEDVEIISVGEGLRSINLGEPAYCITSRQLGPTGEPIPHFSLRFGTFILLPVWTRRYQNVIATSPMYPQKRKLVSYPKVRNMIMLSVRGYAWVGILGSAFGYATDGYLPFIIY